MTGRRSLNLSLTHRLKSGYRQACFSDEWFELPFKREMLFHNGTAKLIGDRTREKPFPGNCMFPEVNGNNC